MKNDTWEKDVEEIYHPEYKYTLDEIDRLFEEEKRNIAGKRPKKNLELIRIYLPKEDFKFLEKLSLFKKLHSLGGIPCNSIKGARIKIDTEVVNPRKRKRKTIVYIKDGN